MRRKIGHRGCREGWRDSAEPWDKHFIANHIFGGQLALLAMTYD